MSTKRILHIEDNPSNRKAVQHILRMTDYDLIEAQDGQQGLDTLETETPDLIMLDMQLPKVSGYEVAKRIKANDRLRDIPVIAVTAYALSGDEEEMIQIGCDDYVSKPYRPKALIAHLEKFLGPARSAKEVG